MASDKPDRRGTPPGKGTILPSHGGQIGNPPHVPTEQDRQNVKTWIKVTDAGTIAAYMEISRDTLDRHYAKELREGRFDMLTTLGGKAVSMALKGDRQMLSLVLRTLGKWSSRVELTGVDGGPIRTFDTSGLSAAAKRVLLGEVDEMIDGYGHDGEGEAEGNGRTLQ